MCILPLLNALLYSAVWFQWQMGKKTLKYCEPNDKFLQRCSLESLQHNMLLSLFPWNTSVHHHHHHQQQQQHLIMFSAGWGGLGGQAEWCRAQGFNPRYHHQCGTDSQHKDSMQKIKRAIFWLQFHLQMCFFVFSHTSPWPKHVSLVLLTNCDEAIHMLCYGITEQRVCGNIDFIN